MRVEQDDGNSFDAHIHVCQSLHQFAFSHSGGSRDIDILPSFSHPFGKMAGPEGKPQWNTD
jgi:hypothetical protein